ncbi:MAG: hypothetical protein J5849_01675 [Clostridia bacterium]|nr:hypothetical protein [Clostridia bacterium]
MFSVNKAQVGKWIRVSILLVLVFILLLLFISFLPSKLEYTIKTQPASVSASKDQTAKFSVEAVGTGLEYQWQYSSDNGKTWHNTSFPGKSPTIEINATSARNGLLFHCVVSNGLGSVTSKSARLTISGVKPAVVSQPVSVTVEKGETAIFKVVAIGSGLSYQWQYSSNGGKTWKDTSFPGNESSVEVEATSARSGLLFRCVVKNSAGTTVSDGAELIVQ